MTEYGKVRVATQACGLVCVALFDAVELEAMIQVDYKGAEPGALVPATDNPEAPIVAWSVRAHYREGGVDTVADYRVAGNTEASRAEAHKQAVEHAFSIADMIMMSDPDLDPSYVLGHVLAQDPRASWLESDHAAEFAGQKANRNRP